MPTHKLTVPLWQTEPSNEFAQIAPVQDLHLRVRLLFFQGLTQLYLYLFLSDHSFHFLSESLLIRPPIQRYQNVAFLRFPGTDEFRSYGVWVHLLAKFP